MELTLIEKIRYAVTVCRLHGYVPTWWIDRLMDPDVTQEFPRNTPKFVNTWIRLATTPEDMDRMLYGQEQSRLAAERRASRNAALNSQARHPRGRRGKPPKGTKP